MDRSSSLFVAVMLILIVGSASLAILYDSGHLTGSTETTPRIVWQNDIEHFASGFAVADGKVFSSDAWANVYCFDAESGKSLWNASIGAYSNNGLSIKVYDDKLYVGSRGSVVNRVNMDTGKVEMSYQAPVWTSWASKWSPSFFVANGKVFAEQNGLAVYDENTGELFWQSNMMGPLEYGNISAPESDYIFIRAQWRVNPNNGSIIWSIPGNSDGATDVTQGKVLFWSYNPEGSADEGRTLLCVNASSGEEVWAFYVGARMFQPIVSNGMVLFGAEDGYLYAVNLADGNLNWKTPAADSQNTTEADVLDVTAFSVHVDPQHEKVFWSVTANYNETGPDNGTILSLDLSNGDRIWTYNVANETSWNFVGVTVLNNILYVSANNNLYCLDANTGTLKLRQNFEHYVLPPIAADDKVFVAADLWLFAYE